MNFDFDIDNLLGVDLTKFLMKKKKVKFIPLDKADETKYPVGRFIQQNMSIILDMITKLKIVNTKDDLILWCRGSSGAIIAGVISSHFPNAKISHVKKDGESSHSSDVDIYIEKSHINVIVDDFISSGNTVNEIAKMMLRNNYTVHGLCVSSSVHMRKLEFKPEFVICGDFTDVD